MHAVIHTRAQKTSTHNVSFTGCASRASKQTAVCAIALHACMHK